MKVARKHIGFENRRNEIPRMIEILETHKDWKSLTFFQYKGGNADLLKPLTRIRVSRRARKARAEYVVTIGKPNYAERQYVKKFTVNPDGDNPGMWPDDFFQPYPKQRKQ